MEEKKNNQTEKLSYEELSDALSDVTNNYNRLMARYQEAVNALNNFDFSSFFLSMLFKVMEHPNRYDEKFIKWCVSNIQGSLVAFAETREKELQEAEKDEAK